MGRPKTPTALAVVRGIRADRVNHAEPIPAVGDPTPPEWLHANAAAMTEWHRLAPELTAKSVLTPWDTQAFAEYCGAVACVALAADHLRTEGHLVEADVFDRNGVPTGKRTVPNPWLQIQKAALEVSARRAARFGLTPSDRSSVKASEPKSAAELHAESYLS